MLFINYLPTGSKKVWSIIVMAEKGDALACGTDMGEMTTKERIIEVAIDRFAVKGFDAVSLREIAEAVGIKKASLYSHFMTKEEILETILDYPMKMTEKTEPHDIGTEELIVSMGLEKFMALGGELTISWMEEPHMEKIFRIICVELYHNDQVKAFYNSMFIDVTYSFWTRIFDLMIKHKLIKPIDTKVLALEYLSFYGNLFMEYFLLSYGKTSGSFRQECQDRIDQHTTFIVNSIKP
jgi:AcrR family transcriptional regulator